MCDIKNCRNCADLRYAKNLFGKVISICDATGVEKENLDRDCEMWRLNLNPFNLNDHKNIVDEILNDKSSSFFIKEAIEKLEKRDIVDVLNDLEVLQSIYSLKLETILKNDGYIVFKDKEN